MTSNRGDAPRRSTPFVVSYFSFRLFYTGNFNFCRLSTSSLWLLSPFVFVVTGPVPFVHSAPNLFASPDELFGSASSVELERAKSGGGADSCSSRGLTTTERGLGGLLDYDRSAVARFAARHEYLGALLEHRGAKRGVELGVQRGIFSVELLQRWRSFEEYVLVDLWGKTAADVVYLDASGAVSEDTQEQFLEEAVQSLRKSVLERSEHAEGAVSFVHNSTTTTAQDTTHVGKRIRVCRNLTSSCVAHFPDGYFDFVYVDARHDYKGVKEDLELWLPKLRPNGIIAGHDFLTAAEHRFHTGHSADRYEINFDGSIDLTGRAVQGAVMDFFGTRDFLPLRTIDQFTEHRSWLVDLRRPPREDQDLRNEKQVALPRVIHAFWVGAYPEGFCGTEEQTLYAATQEENGSLSSERSLPLQRNLRTLEVLHADWPIVLWTPELLLEHWTRLFGSRDGADQEVRGLQEHLRALAKRLQAGAQTFCASGGSRKRSDFLLDQHPKPNDADWFGSSAVKELLRFSVLSVFGGIFLDLEHLVLARTSFLAVLQATDLHLRQLRRPRSFEVFAQCEAPAASLYWGLDDYKHGAGVVINHHLAAVPCLQVSTKFVAAVPGASTIRQQRDHLLRQVLGAEVKAENQYGRRGTTSGKGRISSATVSWTQVFVANAQQAKNATLALLRDGVPFCLKDVAVQRSSCA
ncbi:unnamed protein product [Amoebophrya sp. A120]|nr:unnamed protein product [Amoebophrya sp. A120]|eukprot:GSA120T00017496001.1